MAHPEVPEKLIFVGGGSKMVWPGKHVDPIVSVPDFLGGRFVLLRDSERRKTNFKLSLYLTVEIEIQCSPTTARIGKSEGRAKQGFVLAPGDVELDPSTIPVVELFPLNLRVFSSLTCWALLSAGPELFSQASCQTCRKPPPKLQKHQTNGRFAPSMPKPVAHSIRASATQAKAA